MNENTWKQSARAWWERLNEERAKSAELLRELEQEREMRAVVREQLDEEAERANVRVRELRDALSKLQSESEDCEGELRARLRWTESRLEAKQGELDELLQKLEELRAQPSGNLGDFAALAERIAYADGKHPRDLRDKAAPNRVEFHRALLSEQRKRLRATASWNDALWCEVCEAEVELADERPDRLADELLDVATVAMRWRRAVMERGKK